MWSNHLLAHLKHSSSALFSLMAALILLLATASESQGQIVRPSLTSINPTQVNVGSAVNLSLTGSGFETGSVVQVNGIGVPTTYLSANTLHASVSAKLTANPGSLLITVHNPGIQDGTSNTLTLIVVNPAPKLTSVTPSTLKVGSAATTITLTGSGFVSNTVVQVNGADIATTYGSATSLKATIPANLLTTAGTLSITAFTPLPGGGISAPITITVK